MIKGMDALQRRLGSIKQAIQDEEPFRKAAHEWLDEDVLPTAHRLVPKATGALDRSITGEITQNQIRLGATAPHAAFVEEGTSKQDAQPFLRPAIDMNRPKLSARTRDHYKRRLAK